MKSYPKSKALFAQAKKMFPGGVNSPVRAFKTVGGEPLFLESAKGAYLYDVDGNCLLDYFNSWGPMIAGHAHPAVLAAVCEVAQRGLSFGACHELELTLAEQVLKLMPSLERLRFVSSGTEACLSVIRLARAYTGREKILKFNGNYHGHGDGFLVAAGSGVATFGLPDSPGVPSALAALTLSVPYNDLEAVEAVFATQGEKIAAIILEPVVGNAGCLLPELGFLEGLRAICDRWGALLVFDEVMTGFRVALGGAQERFGVKPDLTTLGKIIGGGLPVGAYGGRSEIMARIAPEGDVYQAGTLSGNPLGMAAGLATLQLLQVPGFYEGLGVYSDELTKRLLAVAGSSGERIVINACGAMFTIFFEPVSERIIDFEGAKACNSERFARFFKFMLDRGFYFPPSQFEAIFFGSAHGRVELENTVSAFEEFCMAGRVA